MDMTFMIRAFTQIAAGVPLTLMLSVTSLVAGGIMAAILTSMRLSGYRVLDSLARLYVFIFRGTPLLVQIFIIYYGLGQFQSELESFGVWGFFRQPFWCAISALSLNTAAYASEIFRMGLLAVPAGQIEAAASMGMSRTLTLRRIVFPISVRAILPAYGNELILMTKATSLASTITMMEITGIAAELISQTFRVVEVFVAAGSIYLILNFCISRLIIVAEWKLSAHSRPLSTTLTSPRTRSQAT